MHLGSLLRALPQLACSTKSHGSMQPCIASSPSSAGRVPYRAALGQPGKLTLAVQPLLPQQCCLPACLCAPADKARDKASGEVVALKKVRLERARDGLPVTSARELRVLQQVMGTREPCGTHEPTAPKKPMHDTVWCGVVCCRMHCIA